jgi:hypothetical protein
MKRNGLDFVLYDERGLMLLDGAGDFDAGRVAVHFEW